jgi:hypothetical protein
MGAWGYCFLSNDDIQDELSIFNKLSSPEQVVYFNLLRNNTKQESLNFKASEDTLPLEYTKEEYLELVENLVDPEQDTSQRELF